MVIKHNTSGPLLEKIEPTFGSSFAYRKFEKSESKAPPFWHFHPELQIVYIEKGGGKRHVGNHVSYFNKGDLVMLGPNLPHFGFLNRQNNHNEEIVIQMKEDFLGDQFLKLPEMQQVSSLFERSRGGLSFHGDTKRIVGERLTDMAHMTPFEKLTTFIKVLDIMAKSDEYQILNVYDVPLIVNNQDSDRINDIYNYVRSNFTEEIPLSDIASHANMTVPAFCRYFKKHTSKTFTQFVNQFRIVHACKLLNEEAHSITDVCFECGFNNFSHFNRSFKKVTGKTPSQYRKEVTPSFVRGN